MKVSELMKREVFTCHTDDTLNTAARVMWEKDCGCVPVIDDENRVMGMLTDRDICMAAYFEGARLEDLKASSAMSKTVFACKPDQMIADAERIMRINQVRRLPVVDDGNHLLGILSLNDIAGEAGFEESQKKKEVTFAEVGKTLEGVCKHRTAMAA